jgi:hypothetical protein
MCLETGLLDRRPLSFGDDMALYREHEGRFYRPDGTEIPFKRCKAGELSEAIDAGALGRIENAFDLLHADGAQGALDDGRQRVNIFHPDHQDERDAPADRGQWVMPCPPAE